MITECVRANALSCLLNEDPGIEQLPEPFRMQSTVTFCVPYSEYSKYILSLRDTDGIILMTPLSLLRDLASSGSPLLFKYFLRDVAFAICKELFYATAWKRDASVILPTTIDGTVVPTSRILTLYTSARQYESELCRKMDNAGYTVSTKLSEHNANMYRIAVVLYHLSYQDTTQKQVSLVYDL